MQQAGGEPPPVLQPNLSLLLRLNPTAHLSFPTAEDGPINRATLADAELEQLLCDPAVRQGVQQALASTAVAHL